MTPDQRQALADYWAAKTPQDECAAYARMMELGLPDSYRQPDITERVARAICRAMNINPDGYNAAHAFNSVRDVRVGSILVTLRNWEAAAHVAEAAIEEARR